MIGQRVKCINDSNRPAEFPIKDWVRKNEIYTVSKFDRMHMQGSIYGIQVEEINSEQYYPYTHFAFDRFVPIDEDGPLTDEELDDLLQEIEIEELETV